MFERCFTDGKAGGENENRRLRRNLPNFVILSAAKDLLSRAPKRKQVLRCAQDDNS